MSFYESLRISVGRGFAGARLGAGFTASREEPGRWSYLFEPDVRSDEVRYELTPARSRALDEILANGNIGLSIGWVMGFDGDWTSVELTGGFNTVTFRWWQLPDAWQPLGELVHLFVDDAREQVPMARRLFRPPKPHRGGP